MDPAELGVTADLSAFALSATQRKLLLSLLSLGLAWALRGLLLRIVRRGDGLLSDRQRWWLSLVKNLTVVAAIAVLATIWSSEISNAALSLAAVAVALVVATKELILCISGAAWRGLAQPFSVGDWIEVGAHSGEVIDESLLVTELQEIDPYDYQVTGRVVAVPNSLLLTQPVVNNGFRKRFIPLTFEIIVEPRPDAVAVRARIEAALRGVSAEFHEVAHRYAARIEKTSGARLRNPEPHVALDTNYLAKLVFRVMVFCPRDRAAELRAAAMAAVFEGEAAAPVPVALDNRAARGL